MGLTDWWHRRQQQRALARRAIPDELWLDTLAAYPFLARRPMADLLALRELTALFLDRKEFSGAGGLELRDDMAVAVAAQACVPVLHLGLDWYEGFVGIVLHPDEVVVPRSWVDEDGIVHEGEDVLAGEAMPGGPLMLSWQDVQLGGEMTGDGYNVVIHEFVHVIDMADGAPADGCPPLPGAAARQAWEGCITEAHADLCAALERGEDTFLDPYAAHGPDEFFPVAAEAFFTAPVELRQHHPAVYRLFQGFFGQDPAAWAGRPAPRQR